MLLLGTVWYIFISIWDIGMILNLTFFYALKGWARTVPWVVAFVHATYFYIGLGFEIVKLFQGETWKDTVQEIFFAYVLWLNTPTAIIELIYIVSLPLKTRDLGISHDD